MKDWETLGKALRLGSAFGLLLVGAGSTGTEFASSLVKIDITRLKFGLK